MKPQIYVETSIPSFYYEVRTEPDIVARREWTRKPWLRAADDYELVTSAAGIDELSKKEFPGQQDALDLMSHLPLVPLEPEIGDIVVAYIKNKVMPADPSGDALHLALACIPQVRILVDMEL